MEYLDFPKLPVTVANFDAWVKANPDEAIDKRFILDGTYNAEEISKLLLKAHWREDAWKVYAQSSQVTIAQLLKIIAQQFDELDRMREESDLLSDGRKELLKLMRSEGRETGVMQNKLRADREHERWKTAALSKALKDGKWRPQDLTRHIFATLSPEIDKGRPYSEEYVLKFIRGLKSEFVGRLNAKK